MTYAYLCTPKMFPAEAQFLEAVDALVPKTNLSIRLSSLKLPRVSAKEPSETILTSESGPKYGRRYLDYLIGLSERHPLNLHNHSDDWNRQTKTTWMTVQWRSLAKMFNLDVLDNWGFFQTLHWASPFRGPIDGGDLVGQVGLECLTFFQAPANPKKGSTTWRWMMFKCFIICFSSPYDLLEICSQFLLGVWKRQDIGNISEGLWTAQLEAQLVTTITWPRTRSVKPMCWG